MYPLSKNKASFRIADILHQQQQQTDSQLLAHHLMMKNVQSSEISNLKAQSNESKNSTASKSPSPDTEISPKGDSPIKVHPMYSNFPLPFSLGMHPAFHSAAYLNYADAIHKGESEILP